MEVDLIRISITSVGSILIIKNTASLSDISPGNTAKICITLDKTNPVAKHAVFFAADAINQKFNDHETEL